MPLHRFTSLQNLIQPHYVHEQVSSAAPQQPGIGEAALRFANAHTPLGSSNQRVGHLSAMKPWTPQLPDPEVAEEVIDQLRDQAFRLSNSEFISEIQRGQAGNCGERCQLVCYFLSQQPDPPIYYRVTLHPGDHGFVALNQKPTKQGLFPDNFNDWNDDAVIIDPWIGICAPARHYPELWRMKLDTMAAVGIELSNGYGPEGRNWLKANSDYWQKVPDVNKKYVTGRTPRPKSGKIECQTM